MAKAYILAAAAGLGMTASASVAEPAKGVPPVQIIDVQPVTVTKDRLDAAERYLTAADYDRTIDRVLDGVIAEQRRTLPARFIKDSDGKLSEALAERVMDTVERELRGAFDKHRDRLRSATALIYARHFTAEDLDRLAVIQADPVMRRFNRELPGIASESMALAQAAFAEAADNVRDEVKAMIEEELVSEGEHPAS